eukprot:4148565-Pyramimonas_sp.AAC.1
MLRSMSHRGLISPPPPATHIYMMMHMGMEHASEPRVLEILGAFAGADAAEKAHGRADGGEHSTSRPS